jgi:hypothetical protein
MSRKREMGRRSGAKFFTVPWIWKKGRPTVVCHDWGDCEHKSRRM